MTKELDRRFRHVGRIKRSWGTTHKPTIRRMEEMMSGLFERGRLDILRLIQDGTYSPLQVYDAYRTNELERLPTAATMAPLKETMTRWFERKECSEAHRRSLSQSLRHLLSAPSSGTSVVGDLPGLLLSFRERSQGKHARSFNLARAAAQAYLAETTGRNTPIYHAVQDIRPLKVTAQRRKNPLTPSELREVTLKMLPPYRDMAWDMAITGMGPGEYWGSWEDRGDRILIHGTKRSGRERFVPPLNVLTRPATEYAAFRRALRDASEGLVTPYDLRRSYANWLESAGIPRTRRKLYLGHGAQDVTDLYEWHQVNAFLAEDRVKLANYVFGATEKQPLKLEKA